ncbi:MAG: hypothetical protein COA44_04030 [Arcobacter sp.]|nr:MAG: hypothetical protein COA44_04030 [Arcobacter sp.]
MKKTSPFILIAIALIFSGCGVKTYVDIKSKNYATLQLIPKSETLIFTDDYYTILYDISKGCKNSVTLGAVETDSDTPSRIVKIPVEKKLRIHLAYKVESGNSTYTEYTNYVLKPKKGKHYIFEYAKKEISFFKTLSEFDAYMMEGKEIVRIPSKRIGNYDDECK